MQVKKNKAVDRDLYRENNNNLRQSLLFHTFYFFISYRYLLFRVVHPDPDRIRIQRLCGSGSVLGIRIRIQGQEKEEISVGKSTFWLFLKKILPLKRYKIAITTF
jgi:hypothetical protein